jgi:homoserine O-acetyltransferase
MNPTFFDLQIADELSLESGSSLSAPVLRYMQSGNPQTAQRVIWVSHALTANADVFEWWSGLFGHHKLFDPEQDLIICPNILGSCYGSTGPLSVNPKTGQPYFHSFPAITVRDMAYAQKLLMDKLNIEKVDVLIGASLGGQQALELAYSMGKSIEKVVLISTNAQHSPWGIAFNESQRMAIKADPSWANNEADAGLQGLKAARAIALLSYRSYQSYQITQLDKEEQPDGFRAASYQQYQGEKLALRFNAFSYWTLSKAMDSHHIGRGRGGIIHALGNIPSEVLVIGIVEDVLFPVEEQKTLARYIPSAQFCRLSSPFGHDGFLIETQKIKMCIQAWIEGINPSYINGDYPFQAMLSPH